MVKYFTPRGGLAPQGAVSKDKSVFTESYALIAKEAWSDIVTSKFPHWKNSRAWVIARPMTGFAETFAQYMMELSPHGGSNQPEPDKGAEAVIFVTDGQVELTIKGEPHLLSEGGYAYIAPETPWEIWNKSEALASFHWIRKRYQWVEGIEAPPSFVTSDQATEPNLMPDTNGSWSTTRFAHPEDIRHDMHVNIVNFEPGGHIPFDETHIMEHGLFVLEGKADYRLNTDWHPVEAGDFMWLRAFCPQSCIAKGSSRFRYLLYKDVNRHPELVLK